MRNCATTYLSYEHFSQILYQMKAMSKRTFFCLNAASGVLHEDLSACFCYWPHKFVIKAMLCNIQYPPFDIFPTRYSIIQFIYFWKTALHVSGGVSTHHKEHTQLYLQYLVLVKPFCYLPLLWKSWNWFECVVGIVLICFGAVADATAPKQINTIPTSHSN